MHEQALAEDAVFFALFRLVEIDELAGPEEALTWARTVVESAELRRGLVESVSERVTASH
jgi:hypothetical protein